jgi:uncharacterized membrane protein YdjX (TVP38/TMEM64 family)
MESMALADEGTRDRQGGVPWLRLGIGILVLGLLVVAGRSLGGALPGAVASIRDLGVWGGVAFVALYGVAAVAMAPGSILTLAAGAIFGLGWGVLWVFLGATLGASLAFLVARYVARGWVEQRIASSPRFAAVDRAIGRDGRKIVFLLRLSPIFPFNALNYGLGLTRVRFLDYVVASVGMLPGSLLYVYYGRVAGEVATLAGGSAAAPRGAGYWVVLGLGLLATLAVTTVVTRAARRALAEATLEEAS